MPIFEWFFFSAIIFALGDIRRQVVKLNDSVDRLRQGPGATAPPP